MKAILKAYSIIFLFTTVAMHAFATETPLVEKKKTYTKTYELAGSDVVTLENKFGELKITTWDRNEIKVEVTMSAKGGNEERATSILGRLSIEDGKNSKGVYFRTDINDGEKKHKNSTYKDEGFTINYLVMMPSRNKLSASNEFGSTIIPDFNGQISVSSKFGSLTTGKLSNNQKVNVEFGSADIESVTNGDVEIKFSRAILSNLDGLVRATFEHCSGIQLNLNTNLKGLVIKNDFTNLQLNVNKALSAKYTISTNFGDFHNKTDFDISNNNDNDNDHGPRFKKVYVGKSGSGAIDLKISAEFSQITVGHSLKMDLKAPKKGDKSVNI
ncbi:MAG TPA: hypothetical protein VK616_02380 [Flavitalea sp.]|nr:hypothetical protein [Flavitalea sp.]